MDLKSLLFNPEPTDEVVVKPPAKSPITRPSSVAFSIGPSTSAPNAEHTAEIEKLLSGNRIFDALTAQMNLLAEAIPDEALRLNTAAKSVASLLGLKPEQVGNAISEQALKLTRHGQSFSAGLDLEVKQRKSQYVNHIEDLRRRIEENTRQQERLRAEASSLETDLADTEAHLAGIDDSRNTAEAEFQSAFVPASERLSRMLATVKS